MPNVTYESPLRVHASKFSWNNLPTEEIDQPNCNNIYLIPEIFEKLLPFFYECSKEGSIQRQPFQSKGRSDVNQITFPIIKYDWVLLMRFPTSRFLRIWNGTSVQSSPVERRSHIRGDPIMTSRNIRYFLFPYYPPFSTELMRILTS